MKFEIKSRFDNSVLFSLETESLKLSVEAAIKSGANLEGANLEGANLEGANLEYANLEYANLEGANGLDKFPIQIGGHKHWLCTTHDGRLKIGCHEGAYLTKILEEWQKRAEEVGKAEGYSPLDVEIYKLHTEHIAKVLRLLWAEKAKDVVPAAGKSKTSERREAHRLGIRLA